jgi:hypothetical protein
VGCLRPTKADTTTDSRKSLLHWGKSNATTSRVLINEFWCMFGVCGVVRSKKGFVSVNLGSMGPSHTIWKIRNTQHNNETNSNDYSECYWVVLMVWDIRQNENWKWWDSRKMTLQPQSMTQSGNVNIDSEQSTAVSHMSDKCASLCMTFITAKLIERQTFPWIGLSQSQPSQTKFWQLRLKPFQNQNWWTKSYSSSNQC